MSAASTEPERVRQVPERLAAALAALDREAMAWSLLRPREGLGFAQGDIDILVEPAALGRVRTIVEALGFVDMPLTGRDLHAAAYDADAGRFVWLHVQPVLEIAGAVIPARAVLSDGTAGDPPQPADAWLLWILLLRALVDKGELPERHRGPAQVLARRWDGGPPALVSLARAHGLDPDELVELAARADWDRLLRHVVRRDRTRPNRWPRRLARAPARVAALRDLSRRRGLSVAVVGPDGAGKTTLVEGLARSLPLPTRIEYMGLTGGRLRRADALRIPGLVLAARAGILWLRYLRGALHRARGRIVLFDRYTLDGAVPSGRALTLAGRLSRRVQRRICPLPDIVILLDASGATMHDRKGEYAPEVLETWRAAYARLRADVDVLEVIDAEQPADAVRREAEARIWRRYGEIRSAGAARRTRRR